MLLSALFSWVWKKILFWRYRRKETASRARDERAAAKVEQIKRDNAAAEKRILSDTRNVTADDLNKLFRGE